VALASCAGGRNISPEVAREAVRVYEEGRRAAADGDHARAVSLFTRALDLAIFPQPYEARAASREALGEFDRALGDLGRALEETSDVDRARVHFNRARFLQRRDRLDEAEGDFTLAIERQEEWPDLRYLPDFYLGRAAFYLDTGRPFLCAADCEAMLSRDPDPETRALFEDLLRRARARSNE